jgi:dihydrofolate reductase
MRKIKLQMQLSVDGYVAGPKGEMDWLVWDWDDALKNYVKDLTTPVDTILMGSGLAQGFMGAWESRLLEPPTDENAFAQKMVDTEKIVFSKTLQTIEGKNATLTNSDLVEKVNAVKNSEGGDIITYGGARFAAAMIENNLIDELHLFVNPVAVGEGLRIFTGLTKLDLVKSTAFECGIIVNVYTQEK